MNEIVADEVLNITITKEPVMGWLGWYKSTHYPHWIFITNCYANQDITNCPYPLYKTKEDVINQIKKNKMNIDDLTIKVIKVTL